MLYSLRASPFNAVAISVHAVDGGGYWWLNGLKDM